MSAENEPTNPETPKTDETTTRDRFVEPVRPKLRHVVDEPEAEPKPKFVPVVVTPDEAERRENRLLNAGVRDLDLARQIANGPSVCPPIDGHEGSKAATDAVVAFLRDPRMRILVLAGNRGRGKTYAAIYPLAHTALWNLAEHKECRLLYSSTVRVGQDWDVAIREYERAHVLVIDDLGAEIGDWATAQLIALLKNRYDWGRKTIVTTNLALRLDTIPDKLRASMADRVIERRYGDPIMSRMSNPAAAMYVACKGDDLRRDHLPEAR